MMLFAMTFLDFADWVAYLCLLLEILTSFIPHFCVQQILYTLDGHQDRRGAWAFTSLWTISRLAEVFGMTLRTWDWWARSMIATRIS